jgi:ribosomal protein L37E
LRGVVTIGESVQLIHNSRTNRRRCGSRADLGAPQTISCQDRELIVTSVRLSARMASPAFALCNRCESRSWHLAKERPGRPEGRPRRDIRRGGIAMVVHPAGPHANALIV